MITGIYYISVVLTVLILFSVVDSFLIYLVSFIIIILVSQLYSGLEYYHFNFLLDGVSLNLVLLRI